MRFLRSKPHYTIIISNLELCQKFCLILASILLFLLIGISSRCLSTFNHLSRIRWSFLHLKSQKSLVKMQSLAQFLIALITQMFFFLNITEGWFSTFAYDVYCLRIFSHPVSVYFTFSSVLEMFLLEYVYLLSCKRGE